MFLQLAHTKPDVYKVSRQFVLECYRVTKSFPAEEKFTLVQQVRRAALSVHLDIAEGCSGKSLVERKRFFEVSRGSVAEVDAAFDIACSLNYCMENDLAALGKHLVKTFKILSGLIAGGEKTHH